MKREKKRYRVRTDPEDMRGMPPKIKIYRNIIIVCIFFTCVSFLLSCKRETHIDYHIRQDRDNTEGNPSEFGLLRAKVENKDVQLDLLKEVTLSDKPLLLTSVFLRLGWKHGDVNEALYGSGNARSFDCIYDVPYKDKRLLVEVTGQGVSDPNPIYHNQGPHIDMVLTYLRLYFPTDVHDVYKSKSWIWFAGEIQPRESCKKKYTPGEDPTSVK